MTGEIGGDQLISYQLRFSGLTSERLTSLDYEFMNLLWLKHRHVKTLVAGIKAGFSFQLSTRVQEFRRFGLLSEFLR